MDFTRTTTVKEVLDANPATAEIFREFGMQCLGCPSATGESLAGAARTHNIDEEKLLDALNAVLVGEMSQQTAALTMPHGAILQRDKKTFAVAPHIPGGVITDFNILRNIADVAEKYNAAALKVTSGQRIAIVGIEREDVATVWEELKMDPGAAVGMCVRSIKMCPGTTFCKRGQQDSIGLGMKLDSKYHGFALPAKFKMAVSGCQNSCSEPAVRDIGIMGTPQGYNIMVGGNAGMRPRLAETIAQFKTEEEVLTIVDNIIDYYKDNAKVNERLGDFIDKVGLEDFKKQVIS
jgi:hybrid cluster-associated redox disulfide protein